jgi:hypothetical protein
MKPQQTSITEQANYFVVIHNWNMSDFMFLNKVSAFVKSSERLSLITFLVIITETGTFPLHDIIVFN